MNVGDLVCDHSSRKRGDKTMGVIEAIGEGFISVRWLEPPASLTLVWDKYSFDEEMRSEPVKHLEYEIEKLYKD